MITRTYKIPEGSESKVDEMVAVAVERFLREQLKETPVEEKVEYQTAVDSFRKDNLMKTKYEVKPIKDENIINEVI